MHDPRTSPAFLRGMTRSRSVSRRDAFRLAGLSAAGLALSACGVQGQQKAAPKPSEVADFWSGKQKNGKVVFANWPEYMPEDRGPLKKFQQETGIAFDYLEVIDENATFFGKAEPQFKAGQPLGYDIIVITNGMQFARMQALGYLVALDHKQLPNFAANAAPKYKNPAYDPDNTYSIPYTSGMTGIAYNTKYVKEPITSIQALFDPKYKGKVGMMADAQEIANYGLLALGITPEKSTKADWEKAAALLDKQREDGLVRKYFDQDYIDAVSKGDVWLTMGWSGDVFQRQLAGEPVAFAVPEEGGTIWTDNMMIPKGAANPVDALMLMDHLYKPEVAAELTEYIQYVTPVPAVKELLSTKAAGLKGEDKEALEAMIASPLVFPSEEDYAKLHGYVSPTEPAEQEAFQSMFQAVTQG
ncbi:polyamine-binding lipoprotein [Planobispora rosea]|uniref:Polyamine-binding lipoprotein n=1 Tax=Planobispora rosea TaxID=35762 RepID=A0A8J3S810_PLARO|nr:spermidine/putrescine ABC transporter substrate-binding protein [Planobispora rosea]GGS89033.1 polyamine-binding lipoprotein [Planobispora rosea]GIH87790.1 polyamine-binding lipoprotein [Planobispora rosea]